MHSNYYTYEWTWAYEKLEEFYGIKPEGMTAEDVIHIVEKWKEAVVGLDRMVYEDAKKEFSLASMTGFGADGSRLEKELDFEQVRGDFESNPFVMAVLKHIEVKTALGDELIGRMQRVSDDIDAIKLVGNGASISMQIEAGVQTADLSLIHI